MSRNQLHKVYNIFLGIDSTMTKQGSHCKSTMIQDIWVVKANLNSLMTILSMKVKMCKSERQHNTTYNPCKGIWESEVYF